MSRSVHVNCRNTSKPYLNSGGVHRQPVPDAKVAWTTTFPDYSPPDYTDAKVLERPAWADPADPRECCRFNEEDDQGVNRRSYVNRYALDPLNGRPLNPCGRTGLAGRGLLGRWGPNHAADPIVSRRHNGRLQFAVIERSDTGQLALPGGMLDLGERAEHAAPREFVEEALGDGDELKKSPALAEKLGAFWRRGREIHRGYVDDARNTDNAWLETSVFNYHDEDGLFEGVELKAASDAKHARWVDVEPGLVLYASHIDFVRLFAKTHGVEDV
jgi:ADP-ribose pyrophosphatase